MASAVNFYFSKGTLERIAKQFPDSSGEGKSCAADTGNASGVTTAQVAAASLCGTFGFGDYSLCSGGHPQWVRRPYNLVSMLKNGA